MKWVSRVNLPDIRSFLANEIDRYAETLFSDIMAVCKKGIA